MKKALSLVLLISLILTILVGCIGGNSNDNQNNDGNQNGNTDSGNSSDGDSSSDTTTKQIPVYQGMSISSVKESAARIKPHHMMAGTNNGNGNNGDNGNHYGQYKGDHSDKDNDPDDEKPFPDNDENENIEEEIKSSLEVIGSPDTIYYASVGQDIFIHIHIHNPDSFEIMSFTLNGKKYSSYMFEDGSDMETIILKYNVGEASGIIDYTIDAIKYVDGTEIKDVIIDGDKTVRAGVRKDNQVVANVSDIKIGTDSISFNVNVKDNDNLIAFADGKIHAVLYDGFEIINQVELNSGENQVCFDGLKTSSTYQYAIVGHYDNLNGNGFGMNVLYKDAFMTEAVVLFDNIVIGQEYISFDFAWHNDYQNSNITSLNLYQDEASMNEQSVNSRYIDGLLSGSTYFLVAEFDNNGKTESIQLEFTTFAKGIPDITLSGGEATKTSISFNVTEMDAENIGSISKIELIHASGTTVADNVDVREFTGLLSDNSYTIRVTYSYDLNDGNGVQTVIKEAKALTKHNEAPVVSILNVVATTDSISFEVEQSYTDVPAKIVRFELVSHGQIVQTITDSYEFTGLFSDHDYTISVVFEYDLNNGYGVIETLVEYDITTVKKPTPNAWVQVDYYTLDTIGYDAYNLDNESILSVYVELIDSNGNVIAKQDVVSDYMEIEGLNLLSNSKYILRFTFTYDLNDGKGVQTFTYDHDVLTVTLDKPVLSLTNEEITVNSIKADLLIKENLDVNYYPCYKTFVDCTFEIYKGSELVATSNNVDFGNLIPYTDYTIKCIYSYDLKDGSGVKTESVDFTYTTQPYIDVVECKIANTSAVSEGDTIFMQVKLDNPSSIAINSLVVNGKTYSVTSTSTSTMIFVEIINNGQFDSGDTHLNVEQIIASKGEKRFVVTPETQLSGYVFIMGIGEVEVISAEFINENFEHIDWAFPSDKLYCLVTISNPDGCNIDAINGIEDIYPLNDNQYYYEVTWINSCGWFQQPNLSISYSNEYMSKRDDFSIVAASCFIVKSNETKYISTPEDLKTFAGGGYYCEFTNDIDLSGVEWTGAGLWGVLDGKGYSVKNMSYIGTINETNARLGLFEGGYGIIKNTNIESATIIATTNAKNAYLGGFIAEADGIVIIENCSIDNQSVFSLNNTSSNASYVGGFVGYFRDINSSSIFNKESALINCFNGSSINGKYAGGFVGASNSNISITIKNCVNIGSVSGNNATNEFIASGYKKQIVNSYTFNQYSGYGNVCTISHLNSKEFYTNTLGWSEDIWDLSELDVENGKYPKLKQN